MSGYGDNSKLSVSKMSNSKLDSSYTRQQKEKKKRIKIDVDDADGSDTDPKEWMMNFKSK
jgi:hypothetical protein